MRMISASNLPREFNSFESFLLDIVPANNYCLGGSLSTNPLPCNKIRNIITFLVRYVLVMTKKYLSNLFSTYQKGDTREKTYYEYLADFVRDNSREKRKPR